MNTEQRNISVPRMFDSISSRYDRINRVLSFGIDRYWRKAVCHHLPRKQRIKLLDCATGTGDQLVTLLKNNPQIYDAVGIDPAEEMLALAAPKITPYRHKAKLMTGVAEMLPFSDGMFDVVTISFGIRNVADLDLSLKEIHRVLAPRGKVLILEFSHPLHSPIRMVHRFYLTQVVPLIGRWLSHHAEAYSYLSETIESFPQGSALCEILRQAQFKKVEAKPMTLGTVTLYIGEKS